MSIRTEIERLKNSKINLRTNLEVKGVVVDNSEKIDKYSDKILEFPQKLETYYYPEAFEVARKIQSVKASNPSHRYVTFGCITDSHVSIGDKYEAQGKASIKSAAFALELVGNMVEADFLVNLGDNCSGNRFDNSENNLKAQKYLRDVCKSVHDSREMFHLVGNHERSENTLDVFNLIGSLNNFDTPTSASASLYTKERGYGYKDFADYKLRVICLNTTDYWNLIGGNGMSYEQKKLFSEFLDLSDKVDSSEWQILILSHIPLDFNTNIGCEAEGDYNKRTDLKKILDAYVDGSSTTINIKSGYSATDNVKSDFTVDYIGKNKAKIICNIHGHLHQIRDQINPDNDIVQICTPNVCGIPGITQSIYYGYSSFDGQSYEKTQNSAQDTSCTFYVIDLDEHKIYSYIFGAGNTVDREISYSVAPRYKITNILTNCSTDNTRTSTYENTSFSSTITANNGCEIDSQNVSVMMGGEDITSTVYADGIISIENVTDDVVITVTATVTNSEPAYKNLLSEFNEEDYLIGVRFKSDKQITTSNPANCIYWCTKKAIEITDEDAVIRGLLPNNTDIDTKLLFVAYSSEPTGGANDTADAAKCINGYYSNHRSIQLDSDNKAWKLRLSDIGDLRNMTHIRICGTPADSWGDHNVFTVNEEIIGGF